MDENLTLRPPADSPRQGRVHDLDYASGCTHSTDCLATVAEAPETTMNRYARTVLHHAAFASRWPDGHGVVYCDGPDAFRVPRNGGPDHEFLIRRELPNIIAGGYSFADVEDDESRPFFTLHPDDDPTGASKDLGWGPGWYEATWGIMIAVPEGGDDPDLDTLPYGAPGADARWLDTEDLAWVEQVQTQGCRVLVHEEYLDGLEPCDDDYEIRLYRRS